MHWITKTMYTETAHRLPGHPGLCRNLHGHSYKWEVSIGCHKLEETGMVMDFSDLKKLMEEFISPFDHAVVVTNKDTHLLNYVAATNQRHVRMDSRPTAENMASWIKGLFEDRLGNEFVVAVKIWETSTSYTEVF